MSLSPRNGPDPDDLENAYMPSQFPKERVPVFRMSLSADDKLGANVDDDDNDEYMPKILEPQSYYSTSDVDLANFTYAQMSDDEMSSLGDEKMPEMELGANGTCDIDLANFTYAQMSDDEMSSLGDEKAPEMELGANETSEMIKGWEDDNVAKELSAIDSSFSEVEVDCAGLSLEARVPKIKSTNVEADVPSQSEQVSKPKGAFSQRAGEKNKATGAFTQRAAQVTRSKVAYPYPFSDKALFPQEEESSPRKSQVRGGA
mmetsp:Transcript_158475/g.295491  ORF Transcript_158475/g.295491 Transcript_158475/m.295491 type:complete len:259 (+) Transcript_158475:2-778(+)